jgi:hypothetical protein
MADQATRDGVAERLPPPAGHKSLAVDLARMGPDDHRRREVELAVRKTATPPEATTRCRRCPVPGSGAMLSLVLREESPHRARCPRGHECVSCCRLVPWAQAAAGTR